MHNVIHWSSKLQKFFNGTNTTKIQRTAITFPRFNVFRSQWILWIIHIIRSFRTYIIRTDHKITIDSTFLLRNVRWNVLVSPKQPQISTLKSAYLDVLISPEAQNNTKRLLSFRTYFLYHIYIFFRLLIFRWFW